jgi:hypothetical protein
VPSDTKSWSADQYKFQLWLALPSSIRKPKTQRAIAEELGVHESTLSDWKKLPGWRDAVNTLALDLVRDDVPDVLASTRREAKKGSFQHQKMILEMVGLYTERREVSGVVVSVNADNMAAAVAAVNQWERERFGEDQDDDGSNE